jgi:hypothetical protein
VNNKADADIKLNNNIKKDTPANSHPASDVKGAGKANADLKANTAGIKNAANQANLKPDAKPAVKPVDTKLNGKGSLNANVNAKNNANTNSNVKTPTVNTIKSNLKKAVN